jgi:hypothetical protein
MLKKFKTSCLYTVTFFALAGCLVPVPVSSDDGEYTNEDFAQEDFGEEGEAEFISAMHRIAPITGEVPDSLILEYGYQICDDIGLLEVDTFEEIMIYSEIMVEDSEGGLNLTMGEFGQVVASAGYLCPATIADVIEIIDGVQ